jgi:hypothetical protein
VLHCVSSLWGNDVVVLSNKDCCEGSCFHQELPVYVLAHRRVDEKVATWRHEERSAKGITGETSSWEEFKQFLRARFLDKSVESNKAVVLEVEAKVDGYDTPLRGMSIQLHKLSNGDEAVRRN